jgi:hypothetical protein
LKYWIAVKAWDRFSVGAAAAVALLALALPAGAAAGPAAHPRHVEFRPPAARATLDLGDHDGYELGIVFEEPDYALLFASTFDGEAQSGADTVYGAHFEGSLAAGRVRARFGSLGSVAVDFVGDGKGRTRPRRKNCEGRPAREEDGHFLGRIDLQGEGDYFAIKTGRARGYVQRSFYLRCRVKRQAPVYPVPSLRERVEPTAALIVSSGAGGVALLQAGRREGNRQVELRAIHQAGAPPGADVMAQAFEYQGKMPVGRSAFALLSPAGTLLTSLPGEHPATATLKPAAPFSGEATYLAKSHLSHSWTGDLSVRFPGLLEPLAGPEFFSTLCVVSPLRTRYGCAFLPPNWEAAE